MFVNVNSSARFSPERPVFQPITENSDCRVLTLGLEAGQSVPAHSSASTVLMHVVEGKGRIQVGDEEREVTAGDMAVCPAHIAHGLAAAAGQRLVVLVTIAPRP